MRLQSNPLLLLAGSVFLLSGCGGSTPAPEPVLLSQFSANTDRFTVVSAVGKPDGSIQKDGRNCDIYRLYTTGLTSGGRAAVKAAEVLTSVATLGVAQIGWAIGKAGTRPQVHTVLFCFASNDKLVDIYDKDPTNTSIAVHRIVNREAYSAPIVMQAASSPSTIAEVAASPASPSSSDTGPTTDREGAGATVTTDPSTGAEVIHEKPVAPRKAAEAGSISLGNVSQEATTGLAQVPTEKVVVKADATAEDLNDASARQSEAANKAALHSR
ncbi:hypothetical protein HLH36_18700 [Gluconacetobacter aggeris]|uniref:Lipoprotein n=1 Tax=Gluconacetobacter aggeris TaxID=1286186 RepID=A0A7W4IWK6_9PROT|nr:hypothetical protein [Gluconacetobacter aggeris]MBB2170346.1 hypothetical protein [Gluconacetobacter aggeris]